MVEDEITKYLEKHYYIFFKRSVKLRVTNVVDRGYYYQFNLWDGKIVSIGETVMKLDLELQSFQVEPNLSN